MSKTKDRLNRLERGWEDLFEYIALVDHDLEQLRAEWDPALAEDEGPFDD